MNEQSERDRGLDRRAWVLTAGLAILLTAILVVGLSATGASPATAGGTSGCPAVDGTDRAVSPISCSEIHAALRGVDPR